MAELPNDAGTLRLRVDLVDREAPVRGPVPLVTEDGRVPAGRLLAAAGVEYLDPRDGEWWPLVRLPVFYVAPEGIRALAQGLADFLRGAAPGLAWQSEEDGALGLQLGAPGEVPGESVVVEVGLDLSLFLAEVGAGPRRPGMELSLFRFQATRAGAVAFAEAVRREAEGLLADG